MSTSLPETVAIPSFTQDGVSYDVNRTTGDCTCPYQRKGLHDWCKHAQVVDDLSVTGENIMKFLDGITNGLLADYKTPILTLKSFETDYVKPTRGFEEGAWQHCLCHDGAVFLCVSWHIDYEYEQIRYVPNPNTWSVHIPETQVKREVKNLYRRPNYELSHRPVKN